jgi:hypothetical protein
VEDSIHLKQEIKMVYQVCDRNEYQPYDIVRIEEGLPSKSIKRGCLFQALDILGYLPLIAIGVGAVRIGGAAIASGLAKICCAIGRRLDNEALVNKCTFIAHRALGEMRRGALQEIFVGGIVPFGSLFLDQCPPSIPWEPDLIARGSAIHMINEEPRYLTKEQQESNSWPPSDDHHL